MSGAWGLHSCSWSGSAWMPCLCLSLEHREYWLHLWMDGTTSHQITLWWVTKFCLRSCSEPLRVTYWTFWFCFFVCIFAGQLDPESCVRQCLAFTEAGHSALCHILWDCVLGCCGRRPAQVGDLLETVISFDDTFVQLKTYINLSIVWTLENRLVNFNVTLSCMTDAIATQVLMLCIVKLQHALYYSEESPATHILRSVLDSIGRNLKCSKMCQTNLNLLCKGVGRCKC